MKLALSRFISKLGLPLISLFIAIILWLYAVGEQSVEVTLKVPLKVDLPQDRMAVLSSSLRNIKLRLSVPRHILSVVSQQSVRAYHEIKGIEKAGEYNFRIEARDILLPPGNIRVLEIYPEVVTVTLDELIVQKLPIRVPLEGEPAHGYVIDRKKMDVNPNAVLIEGPKGRLEKLEAVNTEALDVVGRTRSFRRKVGLALDPDLRSVTDNLMVDAFVPIRREFSVSVFHDVAVKVLKSPKTLSLVTVEPQTVSFALSGPKEILDQLKSDALLAFVDVGLLEKGSYDLPLQLKLPEEVQLNHEPPVLKVKVD